MSLEKKRPKIGTFQLLSLFFVLNVVTKLNNFPTDLLVCWYETGNTHIFNFGLMSNGSSWVEPVLSSLAEDKCLAQGQNTVPSVRLEPATPLSGVKHSSTESLCSILS